MESESILNQVVWADIEAQFGLQEVEDDSFFWEWQRDLPEISETERRSLDRVKASFSYVNESRMSEAMVKLVMLSPLLLMADFYNPPFRMKTEAPVETALEDDGKIVRGQISGLFFQERFWAVVVDPDFSLKDAIAQALSYMMATPHCDRPAYGLATNGSEFMFIKLTAQPPQYALSDLLTLQRRTNDLYEVLAILKRIGTLVKASV
jgi:hypothetical protein